MKNTAPVQTPQPACRRMQVFAGRCGFKVFWLSGVFRVLKRPVIVRSGGRAEFAWWRPALWFSGLMVVMLVASANALRAQTVNLPLPWTADFSSANLGPSWTTHCDSSNHVAVRRDALEFRAHANTRAYVERELHTDSIRISCALKSGEASTPALLCVSWDDSNFIEFGLNSPVSGRLNVREVLGHVREAPDPYPHAYPYDYDLGVAPVGEWQCVAIELARDCIRYLVSPDGKTFKTVHVSPRPERFAGAPNWLGVGQGSGGEMFPRPTPWIAAPSTTPVGVCWIRDLRVESLDNSRITATAVERRQIAEAGLDLVGEQELSSSNDPSFDSVSRHFPAMKWSREVVGVKDHPCKIGVATDGSLQFSNDIANYQKPTAYFQIGDYRFGSRQVSCAKKLLNGWIPVVTTMDRHDGLDLEQTVFGWTTNFSPDAPLIGYLQFRATNPTDAPRTVALQLVFAAATNAPSPLSWQLNLPAHGSQTVFARVPYDLLTSPARKTDGEEFQDKLTEVTAYWDKLIARGSRFEIPEARVQNAYRAWIAYNFLNVAKRDGVYEVCDGSGFYNLVYGYSAALYCNGMDLLGYPDLAVTYCDALLSFAHTNGLLAVNFGDTDTGTALWVMAEHFRLTRDTDWLRHRAPMMRKMCGWIVDQRHAALANAAHEPAVTRGLIRYRPYADLLHPTADYFSNGYLWKGLDATARVFADIGLSDEATGLQREADAYLRDIRASMDAAVFTDGGMKILPLIPDTHELWKESNGSANGYYGIIAPCLLEAGVPAWNDPKAQLITQALEKRGGLTAGICQFHRMSDHAYTYGYLMNCLQRDKVKRVILGFYGSLAYGMSRDTYAAVECNTIRTGENYWTLPHTYSNTQQLRLLRNMLVREEGNTLWLGQAIPRPWLAAGKRVAVNDAPTNFGPVSYSITAERDGSMHVKISPPTRNPPEEILLRLRDPAQRQIVRVESVGQASVKFSKETVRLAQASSPVALTVEFE